MTGRSREQTVILLRDVALTGRDHVLRSGSYRVRMDEELLEGISFAAFRRVATTIYVECAGGVTEAWPIDPAELDAALTAV